MRKRSKYRPHPVLVNPLGYVLEGNQPLTSQDSYVVDLKLKNHGALSALLRGQASKSDINDLIAMHNIQEAFQRMLAQKMMPDLPIELDKSTLIRGKAALLELSSRGAQTGKFICRAPEIQAMNDLIDQLDELLSLVTVRHMERARAFALNEIKCKRAVVINDYIKQGTI